MRTDPMPTSDIIGLTRTAPLSRRGFMTASAAAAAGYTLAAGPVRADVIKTSTEGLAAGDVKIPVADGEMPGYRGQVVYDFVKAAAIRLAYAFAWDLAGTGVTALAITPGFLRSEAMLDRFGVSEANWRDAAKEHWDFQFSETPRFLGRAVAALAADSKVGRKSGIALNVGDLAEEYGFDDADGSRPHFWRNVDGWLETQIAEDGELNGKARRMAQARYVQIHPSAAHAAKARRFAEKLGMRGLGAGLRPLDVAAPRRDGD